MSEKKLKERWYYDACVLDDRRVYEELINKHPPKESFISHLALGEALGNCLLKGTEAASAFFELIEKFQGLIRIIGNDNIDSELDVIKNDTSIRLSITDSIHLATAFKNQCIVFVTADKNDFINIPRKKVLTLASNFYPDSKMNGKAFTFNYLSQKCTPKKKKY